MPLFITEYAALARDGFDAQIMAGAEPAVSASSVTPGVATAQTSALNAQTAFVMLHAQEAVCVSFGTSPTAVVTQQRMAAGETRFYGVPKGKSFKIAHILGV
jgi:hypothetical protein